MIISRQKGFEEILQNMKEEDIFIIGCGKCAAKIHAGGEPEVLDIKKKLVSAGKNITGWTVLSSACSIRSWDEILSQNPAIIKSQALLIMSCGCGVSVISGFAEISVYPALDTVSLGGIHCEETMEKQCGLCGDCNIWQFGGICPFVQCAKGLQNGPCGGAVEEKCEVNDRTCAWDMIYERLKKTGKLEYLEILQSPKGSPKNRRRIV